jgi:UDP-N-acetylmuramoyl-tripeptide--D-alanyl-D-alanine ligase
VLAGETRYARRVAVIGEMLELGASSPDLHRAAGVEAARADVRELIAVGGASARALADGAVEGGIPAPRVHYIENSKDAADLAATVVKPGDIVLVKGSRGIRTDVVVDRLKAECA